MFGLAGYLRMPSFIKISFGLCLREGIRQVDRQTRAEMYIIFLVLPIWTIKTNAKFHPRFFLLRSLPKSTRVLGLKIYFIATVKK